METNENKNSQESIVRSIMDDIREMESIDIEDRYGQTVHKIKTNNRLSIASRWMKYAAILTLPLLLASTALGYLYYNVISQPTQYAEIKAAAGSVVQFELPDHSVVWLNSNSKLRYPTSFKGDKREVSLEGEGYFQVKADKKHPFYVNTPNNFKVYVYGTHFEVNAYNDNQTIETILEEGKVNVITPDNRKVEILPGEELTYDKRTSKMFKKNVDVYEQTGWVYGKLIFRDAPLEEVLSRLSRHFNVKMHFKNLSGHTYHFHATFTDETLPQILDYLSESANIKWTINSMQQNGDSSIGEKHAYITLYK